MRRLEACQSPVWDTALAVVALADAGVPGDDPAMVRAADWLLDKQILARGDWAIRRPAAASPAAGRSSSRTPTTPTSTTPPRSCSRCIAVDHPDPERVKEAVERGVAWVEAMQSSDSGWGAFDADNCRELVRDVPFCDFGEVIDPPSADVTAHVIEMLAALDRAGHQPGLTGTAWLLGAQEADGSWFGRWGVNHVYGTGAAVPGADRRRDRIPAIGADPARGALARGPPERGRRLGRGRPLLRRSASGSDVARAPPRRRPGRCSRCTPPGSARSRCTAASAGWSRPSNQTGPGTSHNSRVRASLRTSTSTTTSTGWCSR